MAAVNEINRHLAEMKIIFSNKYCLIPGCRNMHIIKAHTVQRKGGLAQIAENGKVYTFNGFNPEFMRIFRARDYLELGRSSDYGNHFWPGPELKGINQVSTITAFCSEHDREIFAPIDMGTIVPTSEQIKLFALRCFSYELSRKSAASSDRANKSQKELAKGKGYDSMIDGHSKASMIGAEVSKQVFEDLYYGLKTNEPSLDYILFTINSVPEIVCSFARFINMDICDDVDNLVRKRDLQWITWSCFCKEGKGYILISWDHNHPQPRIFIDSLVRCTDLGNMLAMLSFYCAENVYFSPSWWDSLKTSKKIAIEKACVNIMPDIMRILSEEPRHIVDWEVSYCSNCIEKKDYPSQKDWLV